MQTALKSGTIPHLVFDLDTMEAYEDLEGFAFDIAAGRFTATLVGNLQNLPVPDVTKSDAQYRTRQRFLDKRLSEVNIHARVDPKDLGPLLKIICADAFITGNSDTYTQVTQTLDSYLLTDTSGANAVTSIDEFLLRTTIH